MRLITHTTHAILQAHRILVRPINSTKSVVLAALLITLIAAHALAQMPGDGTTSKGNKPGAPAGSYTLTDFEHLNLFNGNLNFSLPLLQIGGRGGAKSSVNLTIDGMQWHMDVDTPTRTGANITWGAQYQNYLLSPATTAMVNCRWETSESAPGQCPIHTFVCDEIPMSEPSVINLSIVSEYVGPTGTGDTTFNIYPVACGRKPGYGPGVLQGQGARLGRHPLMSLTRLIFIASDGTEYELRDTLTGGKPAVHSSQVQFERGQVFVSAGGEGIIFVADSPIFDVIASEDANCPALFYPAGYLYFSDGTQYRINNNGDIEYIRDANGNKISYLYDSSHRVTQITDSLNRVVIITYSNPTASAYETYDDIKYQSNESTWRHVKVYRASLSHALRSGFSISALADLFEALPGLPSDPYNAEGMATRVELPDASNRSYRLFYNSYGALARVEVPTGGAVEYDRTQPTPWAFTANEPLTQRRVYAEGGSSALNTPPDQKQVYTWEKSSVSSQTRTVNVAVETYARTLSANGQMAEQLQSKEVHSYYGWPDVQRMSFYGPWREGLEFKSEEFEPDGTTPLRRTEIEWEQPFPVSWVTPTQQGQSPETSPANNVRTKSVTTWLLDVSPALVSKQVFGYDNTPAFRNLNNRTDVWEYAYGQDAASEQLLRHTQTKFVVTDASPTPTPSPSPNPSPSPGECIHCGCRDNCQRNGDSAPDAEEYVRQNLVRLPAEVRIFQAMTNNQEQLQSRTEFVYDEAPLLARDGITGWINPNSTARGNVTTTKHWITPTVDTAYIKALTKYDKAGNVIEMIDANHAGDASPQVTTMSYADCFGAADGNARNGSPVGTLTGSTYAFVTSATNALGQTAYTKFDYYSGSPTATEDVRGTTSNLFYNDLLGRLTQVVDAAGTLLQRQTTYTYNDSAHTIVTKSDLSEFGDNKLRSESIYNGLGRTIETRTYESSSSYIITKQVYDGLGRVIESTNPYRTLTDATYGETETTYDALGRTTSIRTKPDNTEFRTAYAGNAVTTTDQAGKQRKSLTDALGRLITVYEAPDDIATYNYQTSYTYDASDNLLTVTQDGQTRTFVYDGLSRLTSATNPESGTTSYSYDANGNMLEKIDPRLLPGSTTHVRVSYTYDALNRQTKRSYNDGTPEINYYYDEQSLPQGAPQLARGASTGQLLAVTYGGSTSINGTYYGYDAIGRTIKSAQVTNGQAFPTMEYGYSLSGSMTWQRYPSGREVTTSHNDAGRTLSVSATRPGETAKTYASLPEYSAHGALTALKLGNGLWEHTTFNPRLQATEIKLGTESNPESMLKLSYNYGTTDNNGNVKSQTITVPVAGTAGFTATQTYQYDPLNRLMTATEMNGSSLSWKQTYSYDRFGNRRLSYNNNGTTLPDVSLAYSQEAIYNPQVSGASNRLVGYTYDEAGNLTTDAQGRTFAYDAENRQIRYNGGASINSGDSASYSYDADGKRVKNQVGGSMSSTVFVYNVLGQLVAEYTDSQQQRPAQTNYLTTDSLGSTRVVTGQDQTTSERHDYLPFGEEVASSLGGRNALAEYAGLDAFRQKFTSKERDKETKLDYFGARYYASRQGRFTSPDNFINDTHPVNPASWNLYTYARNNPLRYIDPLGEEVVNTNLTPGQQQQLIDDWKKKTGYKDIQFKDGKLVVNVEAGREGGSDKAAKQLIDAINSGDTFKLTAVDGTDVTKEVRFSDNQLTGARGDGTNIYTTRIDFGDFKALEGDSDVLESFSVGLIALHEFSHPALDPSGNKEKSSVDNPGPIESTRINPIREELGLPQRQNYNPEPIMRGKFGGKTSAYDSLTFKAKDGTEKILKWQRAATDSVRKP